MKSTANLLTQEEIETLLGGLNAEGGADSWQEGSGADYPAEVIPFSFINQDRIVRGGMPTLEIIHDRFARLMRTSLTQMLRRSVDVSVLTHEELKFGEFNRILPSPTSLHVLRLEPLKGYALLALPGNLIFTMIDIFFGGSGTQINKNEQREFTQIEQRIITSLTDVIDLHYAEAWKPVYPLTVHSGVSETNAQFINIAQASDEITAIDFEILIEDIRCGLSICLPHLMIQPIRETLRGSVISGSLDHDNEWAKHMSSQLEEAVVEVRAMLGSAELTVKELLDLRSGDIIQLHEDYEHPIDIRIQGVPKFWGSVGSHKSTRAVQITGIRRDERKD